MNGYTRRFVSSDSTTEHRRRKHLGLICSEYMDTFIYPVEFAAAHRDAGWCTDVNEDV